MHAVSTHDCHHDLGIGHSQQYAPASSVTMGEHFMLTFAHESFLRYTVEHPNSAHARGYQPVCPLYNNYYVRVLSGPRVSMEFRGSAYR